MKLTAVLALVLAALACAPSQAGQPARAAAIFRPAPSPAPTLDAAIRHSVDLGPADAATIVSLSFGLNVRDPQRLARLIASGRTVSPEVYAAEFGADPVAVQAAVTSLQSAGFRASWRPGSSLIAADGPAPLAAAFLHVPIDNFRQADGTTFYAALAEPQIPPQLARTAGNVSGLDNYRRSHGRAVRRGGLTPTDVLNFYNLKPPIRPGWRRPDHRAARDRRPAEPIRPQQVRPAVWAATV
jgi:hypothetical protein